MKTLNWALWLGAWLAIGELGHRHWPLWAGGLLPLALWVLCLGALQQLRARPAAGCAVPDWTAWHTPRDWPLPAARLVMLPMMAALPALADWCSADGWPPLAVTAAHLAAMLLPLALAQPLEAAPRRRLVAALLAAGGVALLLQDGSRGLMAAGLLHGAAWGVAAGAPATAATHRAAWRDAVVAAALLLALGVAMAQVGPTALVVAHGVLALCGLTGLIGLRGARPPRRHNPAHAQPRHRHP